MSKHDPTNIDGVHDRKQQVAVVTLLAGRLLVTDGADEDDRLDGAEALGRMRDLRSGRTATLSATFREKLDRDRVSEERRKDERGSWARSYGNGTAGEGTAVIEDD